jgi:hypothetical protein
MPMIRGTYPELYQLDTVTQTRLALLESLSDMAFDMFPPEFSKIVRESDGNGTGETDKAMGGFGLPQEVDSELGGVHYDTQGQWFQQTYIYGRFTLGFIVSLEMQEDDQWGLAGSRSKKFGRSWKQLPEVLVARLLNESFVSQTQSGIMNAGRRSPDGVALFSTSHPNPGPGGGVQSNTNASGGIALSHQGIEAMMIRMASRTDDRGIPVNTPMRKLVVPKELYPRALEVMGSSFRSDTLFRVKNVLSEVYGIEVIQNHNLTSATAYFGFGEPEQCGLRWIWRRRPTRRMWKDPNTEAMHIAGSSRFDFGWSHSFASDADPGA